MIFKYNFLGDKVAFEDYKTLQRFTIRHINCEMFIHEGGNQCKTCSSYRPTLRALKHKTTIRNESAAVTSDSHVNYKHLTSVQKLKRLKSIKRKYNNTTKKLAYIRNKIKYLIKKDGITLDESTHDDLRNTLLEKNTAIKGNAFQKIFWSQNNSKPHD